jgi:hypothetical protein
MTDDPHDTPSTTPLVDGDETSTGPADLLREAVDGPVGADVPRP